MKISRLIYDNLRWILAGFGFFILFGTFINFYHTGTLYIKFSADPADPAFQQLMRILASLDDFLPFAAGVGFLYLLYGLFLAKLKWASPLITAILTADSVLIGVLAVDKLISANEMLALKFPGWTFFSDLFLLIYLQLYLGMIVISIILAIFIFFRKKIETETEFDRTYL